MRRVATEEAKLCRSLHMLVESITAQSDARERSRASVEMIMKYFIAMCLLAAPLAISVAPTSAEAGYRDHARCHFVKKTVWVKYGKKRTKWVRVCNKRPRFTYHRRHR
jgi:hypothetical protein